MPPNPGGVSAPQPVSTHLTWDLPTNPQWPQCIMMGECPVRAPMKRGSVSSAGKKVAASMLLPQLGPAVLTNIT